MGVIWKVGLTVLYGRSNVEQQRSGATPATDLHDMNRDPEHNGSYKRGDSDKGAPDKMCWPCVIVWLAAMASNPAQGESGPWASRDCQ